MRRRRVVRVPASSANLGPGYDVLAAGPVSLPRVRGRGERRVLRRLRRARASPSIARTCACAPSSGSIPPTGCTFSDPLGASRRRAGLGSSAAAIVAGLAAADHLYELDAPLFEHALAIEGHPDNVAAALLGGFVVCAGGSDPVRLEPPAELEGVVVVPDHEVVTAEARAALPAEVPLGDAVHNVGHAALLVLGLAQGDLSLIARGLSDSLHQPRRRHLYPRSMELVERAVGLGALGATISGAGPTVLFWCHWEQTGAVVERLRSEHGDARIERVAFAGGGADVSEL